MALELADQGNPVLEPVKTTLLSLVVGLNNELDTADDVARTAAAWIRSGRAVLTGNFKGQRDFEVDGAA